MRPIDAYICLEKIKNLSIEYDSETVQRCIEIVSNTSTIDAVSIIRCKDCINWSAEIEQTAVPEIHRCKWWRVGTYLNDYCSRAERKE